MRVLVPFATADPNTRLSSALADDERREFSRAMLADVLDAIRGAGARPRVLATESIDCDAPVTVDERPLTPAVNAALAERKRPVGVVMADLALATPATLDELFDTPGEVVIAPGRGGGTNALVVRDPAFRVDYHGGSFLKHREHADEIGADLAVFDSHRLATDVDEPADLVEVLVHGEGRAARWLRENGFALERRESRLAVGRD